MSGFFLPARGPRALTEIEPGILGSNRVNETGLDQAAASRNKQLPTSEFRINAMHKDMAPMASRLLMGASIRTLGPWHPELSPLMWDNARKAP